LEDQKNELNPLEEIEFHKRKSNVEILIEEIKKPLWNQKELRCINNEIISKNSFRNINVI